MKQQDYAASVRQAARLDRGMQMKADGEFVAGVGRKPLSFDRRKNGFSGERTAGRPKAGRTGGDDATVTDVAIMGGAQCRCAGLSLNSYIVGTGNDRRSAKQTLDRKRFKETVR